MHVKLKSRMDENISSWSRCTGSPSEHTHSVVFIFRNHHKNGGSQNKRWKDGTDKEEQKCIVVMGRQREDYKRSNPSSFQYILICLSAKVNDSWKTFLFFPIYFNISKFPYVITKRILSAKLEGYETVNVD